MILLIDDDRLELEMQRQMLISYGMVVETATNCDDAIELAQKNKYKLILIDTDMPDNKGFSTAAKLKNIQPETFVAEKFKEIKGVAPTDYKKKNDAGR